MISSNSNSNSTPSSQSPIAKNSFANNSIVKNQTSSSSQSQLSFDVDSFDFKPLSEGLGFHHEEKVPTLNNYQFTKNENRFQVKSNLGTGPAVSTSSSLNFGPHQASLQQPTQQHGLEAFYNSPKTPLNPSIGQASPSINRPNKIVKIIDASPKEIFQAWLLDISVVSFIFLINIALFIFLAPSFLSGLKDLTLITQLAPYLLTLFSTYYFIYFFLTDLLPSGSFGQSKLGLKLISTNGKELLLSDRVIRDLLVMVGFIGLGIPNFFNWQGQLTETKMIKI